jgi:putative PIN family toxin of toxin-antitoxin system
MVFLQGAARQTSPAKACLDLAEHGSVQLCLSAEIVAEVQDVLTRPEVQSKFPALVPMDIEAFITRLAMAAVQFLNVPVEFHYERDPKDTPYINLALVARAEYLVTRDTDLLALMHETTEPGRAFRCRYPFLTILDPVAFLRVMRSRSS